MSSLFVRLNYIYESKILVLFVEKYAWKQANARPRIEKSTFNFLSVRKFSSKLCSNRSNSLIVISLRRTTTRVIVAQPWRKSNHKQRISLHTETRIFPFFGPARTPFSRSKGVHARGCRWSTTPRMETFLSIVLEPIVTRNDFSIGWSPLSMRRRFVQFVAFDCSLESRSSEIYASDCWLDSFFKRSRFEQRQAKTVLITIGNSRAEVFGEFEEGGLGWNSISIPVREEEGNGTMATIKISGVEEIRR